jgi:hypothetical protein
VLTCISSHIYIPYDYIIYFKVSFNYSIRSYSSPQHIRWCRNILFTANPLHIFKQTVGRYKNVQITYNILICKVNGNTNSMLDFLLPMSAGSDAKWSVTIILKMSMEELSPFSNLLRCSHKQFLRIHIDEWHLYSLDS